MAKLIQSLLVAVCLSVTAATADVERKNESSTNHSDGGAATTVEPDEIVNASRESIGILQTLYEGVNTELHSGDQKHQIFNGLVALVLGIIMCADGEFVFRGVVVFCIFTFTSIVTTAECQTKGLHNTLGFFGVHLVSLEVSLVIAYAAYLGFLGIKVILGCILGLTVCYWIHWLLYILTAGSLLQGAVDHAVVLITFATVSGTFGIWLLLGRHKRRLQALLGCFFGGSLLTSAVGYFVMVLASLNREALASSMPWIQKGTPAWVDFLKMLLVPGSTHVGILANSPVDASIGFSADAVLGFLVWFVVSFLGWKYQMKQEKQEGPCMTEKIVKKMASTTQTAVDAIALEVRHRSKTPPRSRAEEEKQLKMPLFADKGREASPRRRPPV